MDRLRGVDIEQLENLGVLVHHLSKNQSIRAVLSERV